MIIGQKIALVAFEPEHWVYINRWMSDDYYKYYFRNLPDNLTVQQMSDFPRVIGMNVLMIVNEQGVVGMATWDNVRVIARQCCIGFILDKEYTGLGYGKDALMEFMYYLTHRLGLHKLTAKIAKSEEATVGKAIYGGFNDKQIMRDEFFMDGKWQDEVWVSILDSEVAQIYNKFKQGELKRNEPESLAKGV